MRLAVLWLATGCTQLLGVHDFEAAPSDGESRTCRGSRWSVCTAGELPAPRTLSGELDTDDPTCRGAIEGGTAVCLIASSTLTISSVRAHGSLPLVLLADAMLVAGALDAATAQTDKRLGPAADPLDCEPATPGWSEDDVHLRGNGGGAGGSFGRAGGAGGDASSSPFSIGDAGGGKPAAPLSLRGLYGGCPGSAGGAPVASLASAPIAAAAGHGGGAVLIIATTLQLDGTIDASGSGGAGGGATNQPGGSRGGGGGGGGAGGLVVLEVGQLTGNGSVRANGGGGGGGGNNTGLAGGAGADGGEDNTCATGGSGGNAKANGGAGGCHKLDALAGGDAATTNAGGGGGGGAVGMILASVSPANASPPVTPL